MTREAKSQKFAHITYSIPIRGLQEMTPIKNRFTILTLACVYSFSSAQTTVKETRKILEEWVDAEKLISEESSSWKTDKVVLKDLAVALQAEIEQLDANLAKSAEEEVGASRQRTELNKRKLAAETAAEELKAGLVQIERELLLSLDAFPTPMLNRLSSYQEKLSNADKRNALPLRDRLETCVTILQAAHLFHESVNLERQEFSLNDGQSREFHVLYFGMSIAYFVNEAGTVAGYGTPSQRGWQWKQQDALSEEIRRGVAIRNKRALPTFLRLPIPAFKPTNSEAPR